MKDYVDEQVAGVSAPDLGALDIANMTILADAIAKNITDIKLGAYTLTNFTSNYATFGAFSNTNYTNLGPYLLANFTANYFGQTDRFTNTNYTNLGPYTFANFTSNLASSGPYTTTNHSVESHGYANLSIGFNVSDTGKVSSINYTVGGGVAGIWYNGSGICIGSC